MKQKTRFVCTACGSVSLRWQGRCNNCGAWESFVEEQVESSKKSKSVKISNNEGVVRLGDVSAENQWRLQTGVAELDRVLGGGIIPGSLVLVGGDPGIGKSTLMLQMCGKILQYKPLYVTGEESLQQIKFRAGRLNEVSDELLLLADTNIERIAQAINSSDCGLVVVDSIQSVHSELIDASPGSILQVRECASLLMQIAKRSGKPIFIIGHVTKEGIIAGPKLLEHLVDTVLQFEGDKSYSYRILRALKNRFGSTNEIGIFDMAESGLHEVKNPSELFLAHRSNEESGVAIVAALEGTRPIMVEVQALAAPSGYGVPQRTSNGIDNRRLQMILAVLEKRLGAKLRQQDVFVNVAGGLYISDPAVDLAVSAALISSLNDKPLQSTVIVVGEIGLTGEVRSVSNIEQRIAEAEKLGFDKFMLPKMNFDKLVRKFSIELLPVERISLALTQLLQKR